MADDDINYAIKQQANAQLIKSVQAYQKEHYTQDHPVSFEQAKKNLQAEDRKRVMDALISAKPAHKDEHGLRGPQPENNKMQIDGQGVSGQGNSWSVNHPKPVPADSKPSMPITACDPVTGAEITVNVQLA